MKLYFAPLEGISTCTYRNAHARLFGGCDAYFAPFINPGENDKISMKNLRDILPEKNNTADLRVQVLTNNAVSFLKFEEKVKELGYDEININIGCPSGTVVHKGRGAGFLKEPEAMDRFFDEIFSITELKISVKTRIGFDSADELGELMRVYNRYPLSLLIIHPRTRSEFYGGEPNKEAFFRALSESKNKVCYNGDIFTVADYENITNTFPEIDSVMIGRGAIANPALFRQIRGGAGLKKDELLEFTQLLIEEYYKILCSDLFTLQKMKEIWMYVMWGFSEEKKLIKAIKKSNKLSEFVNAVKNLPEIRRI